MRQIGFAWDSWVAFVDLQADEEHDDNRERMERLACAIDGWRSFVHVSRSTRWQVSCSMVLK